MLFEVLVNVPKLWSGLVCLLLCVRPPALTHFHIWLLLDWRRQIIPAHTKITDCESVKANTLYLLTKTDVNFKSCRMVFFAKTKFFVFVFLILTHHPEQTSHKSNKRLVNNEPNQLRQQQQQQLQHRLCLFS